MYNILKNVYFFKPKAEVDALCKTIISKLSRVK